MVDRLIHYAWLVPLMPLLGGLIAAVAARRLRGTAHVPVVAGIAGAFIVAMLLWGVAGEGTGRTIAYQWLDVTDLSVPVEFRVDGLTTMMLAMVTFVALLVALFAAGYMAGDPAYPRFFAVFGLFVFSMTGLVLSNNYLVTYAFWEGVGVCSYLLVGFWHEKPAAAAAAKKAFLVNRVGDFGFAVALFWMWSVVPGHSLRYDDVFAAVPNLPHETLLGISLLLFWGATAKSAQVPLYVWLPDAMEGPTPVSALIHAATMVTAGVYLIARSTPLVVQAPEAQLVVAVVGCVTALLAALIALTQTDLKRVLAYSTVSQLGFMFMGLGAGLGGLAHFAVVAAMFHLFTHAFFKALLFLASGSVMHAMGGVIDMRRFRGLRHRLPITCWTFAAGGLALSGIFPLAGFFSKDEILVALDLASHHAHELGWRNWVTAYSLIYWVAVGTAFLTAFYTGRAFFLTFFGPEKLPSADDPEAEPAAAPAAADHGPALGVDTPGPETPQLTQYEAALGVHRPEAAVAGHAPAHDAADPHRPADLPPPTSGVRDEPVPQHHGHDQGHGHGHGDHFGHESPPIMTVPLLILAACAVLVGLVFGPPTGWFAGHIEHSPGLEAPEGAAHAAGWMTPLIGTAAGLLGLGLSYLMYARPSPVPGRLAAQFRLLYLASYRKFHVDELYGMTAVAGTLLLANLSSFFDVYVIDNLVRLTAWVPRFVGRDLLAPFQNGLIQFYAAASGLGVAFLLIILLLI